MHRGSIDKAAEYLKQTKDIIQPVVTLESPEVGSLPGTSFMHHSKCCSCSSCCDPAMHNIQCTLFIALAKYLELTSRNRESEKALNIAVNLCQNATQRTVLSLEELSCILKPGFVNMKITASTKVSDPNTNAKRRGKGRSKVAKETKRIAKASEQVSVGETAEIMFSYFHATSNVSRGDLLLQMGDAKGASKALTAAKDILRKAENVHNGLTRMLVPIAAKLYLMLGNVSLAINPICRQAIEKRWNLSCSKLANDAQHVVEECQKKVNKDQQTKLLKSTSSKRTVSAVNVKDSAPNAVFNKKEDKAENDLVVKVKGNRVVSQRSKKASKTQKKKAEIACQEESGDPKLLRSQSKNAENLPSDSEDKNAKTKRQGKTKRKALKTEVVDMNSAEDSAASTQDSEEKEEQNSDGM